MEFLGKLAHRVLEEGDDCILIANSKIAEYTQKQKQFFPKDVKTFSKVDWCIENYQKDRQEFCNLSWKELFPDLDRFKFFKSDYEDLKERISQLHQFIDYVFQKEKPNIVVYGTPGSLYSEVVYSLCKKYKITYLGLMGSRLPERIDVYDLKHTCSKYKKTFEALNSNNILDNERKFAKDFVRNFISHKQLPPYMDSQIKYSEDNPLKNYITREIKILPSWFKYFSNRRHFKPFDYESELQFKYNLRYPWIALRRRFKALLQRYIFDAVSGKENFFLYPLHVQPELSTSALATYFCDQLNTIKNIAFSLPFPYKLYVKEHPAASGERAGDFYKELKRTPNVVLIAPHENVENLIKSSQGIITLTSTVGMEAALVGKPVYVLGNVFYSYHPLCQEVKSFEELRQKIQRHLNARLAISNLEETNLRFIVSYFKNTIAGDVAAACNKKDTNDYKLIYKEIKRIFLDGKKNSI